MISWYPVIEVLKHTSPTVVLSAPKPRPYNRLPSSNINRAVGGECGVKAGKWSASNMASGMVWHISYAGWQNTSSSAFWLISRRKFRSALLFEERCFCMSVQVVPLKKALACQKMAPRLPKRQNCHHVLHRAPVGQVPSCISAACI